MKIEILDADDPTGGTPFVLIAGGLESPEEQELNARTLLQVDNAIRATSARHTNRGNASFAHAFQITREYESAGDAELALFEHPMEVPREGIIKITFEPEADGEIRYMYHATVHAFAARQIGKTILWRYEIAADEPSETAPTS